MPSPLKSLFDHTLWENNEASIWPASTFILHRNLKKSTFPAKQSELEKQQTIGPLKDVLLSSKALQNPQFLAADTLEPLEKEYLFEHFLLLDAMPQAGKGQGIVIDDSAQFLGLLNLEDHLVCEWVECNPNWEDVWEKIGTVDQEIEESLGSAYSDKFGYLTSTPELCGTGLVVQAFLHVPALICSGKFEELMESSLGPDVIYHGIGGANAPLLSDLCVLQNKFTLGVNEDQVLHAVHSAAHKFMVEEQKMREELQKEDNSDIKDLVARSFGLLKHSYQLQTQEVLDALSLIKLGVHLGWITGIDNHKIHEIFFRARRAHLMLPEGRVIEEEKLPHLRAEYLQQHLADLALNV